MTSFSKIMLFMR